MGQLYKTSRHTPIGNYMKQIPFDAIVQAIQVQDQAIAGQELTLAGLQKEMQADVLQADVEDRDKIIGEYESRIDALTKNIMDDPMRWRERRGDIRDLGRSMYKDWSSGNIANMMKNYQARTGFIKNWQEQHKSDPEKYRTQDFNLALNYFDQQFQGTLDEGGSYNIYQTEQLNPYADFNKILDDAAKGYKADLTERFGWAVKDGVVYESSSYKKEVPLDQLKQGLVTLMNNDPTVQDYANQMAKFYGDNSEQFLNNYRSQLGSSIDRVANKYAFKEDKSGTKYRGESPDVKFKRQIVMENLRQKNRKELLNMRLSAKEDGDGTGIKKVVDNVAPDGDFTLTGKKQVQLYDPTNFNPVSLTQFVGNTDWLLKNLQDSYDAEKNPDKRKSISDQMEYAKMKRDNAESLLLRSKKTSENQVFGNDKGSKDIYQTYSNNQEYFDERVNQYNEWSKRRDQLINEANIQNWNVDPNITGYTPPKDDRGGDQNLWEQQPSTYDPFKQPYEQTMFELSQINEKLNESKQDVSIGINGKIFNEQVNNSQNTWFETHGEDMSADINYINVSNNPQFSSMMDNYLISGPDNIKFYAPEEKKTVTPTDNAWWRLFESEKGLDFRKIFDETGMKPSEYLIYDDISRAYNDPYGTNVKVKFDTEKLGAAGVHLQNLDGNEMLVYSPDNVDTWITSAYDEEENPDIKYIVRGLNNPRYNSAINELNKTIQDQYSTPGVVQSDEGWHYFAVGDNKLRSKYINYGMGDWRIRLEEDVKGNMQPIRYEDENGNMRTVEDVNFNEASTWIYQLVKEQELESK